MQFASVFVLCMWHSLNKQTCKGKAHRLANTQIESYVCANAKIYINYTWRAKKSTSFSIFAHNLLRWILNIHHRTHILLVSREFRRFAINTKLSGSSHSHCNCIGIKLEFAIAKTKSKNTHIYTRIVQSFNSFTWDPFCSSRLFIWL